MPNGKRPGRKKGTPKTGGRAKGTPNKVTAEARDICRAFLESAPYRVTLKDRIEAGRLPPAVETMLWHYAYGKPKEEIELTGADGGGIVVRWESAQP